MAFPNFSGKHDNDSMISPSDFAKYQKEQGKYPTIAPPKGVIFCYQSKLLKRILSEHKVTKVDAFSGEFYILDETNDQIGVIANFGIGAPVAVTLLEELIEFGVKKFISVGTAGALQKNLEVGSLMVCDRSIRDEGTSHHYLAPSKYAFASKNLTRQIEEIMAKLDQKYTLGTSWTIDAPYRETIAEAKQYQEEGVATVEMEASALFAVAQYRGVDLGAIFTISDSLAELMWKPEFHQTESSLANIFQIAKEAILTST